MDFTPILKEIKKNLLAVLRDNFGDLKDSNKKEIDQFLESSKQKLEDWTLLLENGDLTVKDYEWLLKSQKDLLILYSLERAGVSKIKLGHLKNKLLKTVVDVVIGVVL